MKMKLNALSLAIAAAGFAATAAQAADVAMFPYVVNSPSVTTIVSVVDLGDGATQRYDNLGGVVAGGPNLHWRLNYKAGADATNNAATCREINRFLSTSPFDIQTVDIGGRFGASTRGVLFNDPSVQNNWNGQAATKTYMLARDAVQTYGSPLRGVLYVHNADSTTAATIYGEAMVLEFATGASWGYQAVVTDNGNNNNDGGFNYAGAAGTTYVVGAAAAQNGPITPLTIMPPAQVTTMLFVTPVNAAGGSLGADGTNNGTWSGYRTAVSLSSTAGGALPVGLMYDRDENVHSGTEVRNVTCVGAVNVADLLGANVSSTMANGGWAFVQTTDPAGAAPAGMTDTDRAYVLKLEFSTGQSFNGEGSFGTFNNGFIMR